MNLLIVFFSTLLGGLLVAWMPNRERFLEFATPFSGAVLLSICMVHIIPDSVMEMGHESGIYILVGFMLQLILEKYTHGIEHGHSHIAGRYSTAVFWGLGLHAFIEGIPLGYNFRDPHVQDSFSVAVVVHKIPEAFALGVFLLRERVRFWPYFLWMTVFALVTPAAAYIFKDLGESFLAISRLLPYLLAIAIGSFLWISTTIFFESEARGHKLQGRKLVAILLGFVLVVVIDLLFHHH